MVVRRIPRKLVPSSLVERMSKRHGAECVWVEGPRYWRLIDRKVNNQTIAYICETGRIDIHENSGGYVIPAQLGEKTTRGYRRFYLPRDGELAYEAVLMALLMHRLRYKVMRKAVAS